MQVTKTSKSQDKRKSPRERIVDTARRLFDSKGFHATTTAELASEAEVSIGQIYRHFTSKDDIVLAIAEQNVNAHIEQRHRIFEAVEHGELSMFNAIKAFAHARLSDHEVGLFFEVLAESCRNSSVADRMTTLTELYREGIRDLAVLARPDAPPDEINAYVDLMIACFFGLGYRPAIGVVGDIEKASHNIAELLMRSLGLTEPLQRKVVSSKAPRSSGPKSV